MMLLRAPLQGANDPNIIVRLLKKFHYDKLNRLAVIAKLQK